VQASPAAESHSSVPSQLHLAKGYEMHNQITKEKTKERSQQKPTVTMEDFFKAIHSKRNWSQGKLGSNAELLIIAGSEIKATTLSDIAYLLLKPLHRMV
jgi:hypothetical protein